MLVAKISDGVVTEVGSYQSLFPTTSFSVAGPSDEFLESAGAMKVDNEIVFDPAAKKLVPVDPYIDGSVVRTRQLEDLTPEEATAYETNRKALKIGSFQSEAGKRLDAFAVARGYANMVSVCTYDTSSVPRYAADALRARTLRDQWWEQLNVIVADVLAGNRPEPNSFDDIAGELPALTWE